jgi:hypothetical protein
MSYTSIAVHGKLMWGNTDVVCTRVIEWAQATNSIHIHPSGVFEITGAGTTWGNPLGPHPEDLTILNRGR